MPSVPVVCLTDFRSERSRRAFAETVGRALSETGFVIVEGHGISPELLARAYELMWEFFAAPQDTRRQYEDVSLSGQRGYTRFGREHAKGCDAPDLKEFYQIGRDLPADHPHRSQFGDNIWPRELPAFRTVFTELYGRLEDLAAELLEACALFLGEPANALVDMTRDGDSILRLIHYPPLPPDVPGGSMRAAPHEDINLITLLCGATDQGLELLGHDGNWTPIASRPDQIIVDAGDMLQNLTNGLFPSTTHRVVNPVGLHGSRFSLPFFMHPRADVDLTPRPGCVARTGGRPEFPSITAGDYLAQRLREIGLRG